MTFPSTWINSFNSLVKLSQDPVTGFLQGTYSSTTDGSGTYDVVGWASLSDPTPAAGQTMAISILWRSNDGGKSDPSHEVSAMCGQVVATNPEANLVLIHLFVETNPNVVPKIDTGSYPDKLIFTPYSSTVPTNQPNQPGTGGAGATTAVDNLSGKWVGAIRGKVTIIIINVPVPGQTQLEGKIVYTDGSSYPIMGFTDIFASTPAFNWQGIAFSTYIDEPAGRTCIAMAGFLNLNTHKIHLTQLSSKSTASDSTWYQTSMEQWELEKGI
jgi:Avidin family